MAFNSRVYRILIASPSDVEDEREIAVRVIQEWNDLHSYSRKIVLLPLRWETHTAPEYGTRPQEIVNRAIVDECDLLIGVFWTRIGSPTGMAESGTLEEIERVGKAEKPIMLYFSKVAIDPGLIDLHQNEKLRDFKSRTYPKGLVENYKSLIEFRDKFSKQLELRIRDLQQAETEDKTLLEVDFYSPEEDEFSGKFIEKNSENLILNNFNDLTSDNIKLLKVAANKKIKNTMAIPLYLVVRNLSSSGIRNVYVELRISSSSGLTELNEGEFESHDYTGIFYSRKANSNHTLLTGKNSKIAIFETGQLQKNDNSWSMSAEFEAIQPQRVRLIKPLLYVYAPETTSLIISVKILADSFVKAYETELKMEVSVKEREVKLKGLLPDWEEILDDEIPF